MMLRTTERLESFFTAMAAVIIGFTAARLLPVADDRPEWTGWNESAVMELCRVTVRDEQPFVIIVFTLSAAAPDVLLQHVHSAVGAAVLLTNGTAADVRPDDQVVLMIADGPEDVERLIDDSPATWDQLSHYVFLMPDTDQSAAGALFRAAWRQRSVINVVVMAASLAYTYDPFKDVLQKRDAADVDGLRTVARHKMTDLNGYPVRICMFPTRIKAVKQPDGTYKGTDGNVVSTLAKQMNFTPVYSEPSDGKKYGWAETNSEPHSDDQGSESNYTYTGLLGDLVHNKVDMAFNGVFLNVIAFIPTAVDTYLKYILLIFLLFHFFPNI